MEGALEKSFGCEVFGMVLTCYLSMGDVAVTSAPQFTLHALLTSCYLAPDQHTGPHVHRCDMQVREKSFAWCLLKNSTVMTWFLTLQNNSLENRAMAMSRSTAKTGAGWGNPDHALLLLSSGAIGVTCCNADQPLLADPV